MKAVAVQAGVGRRLNHAPVQRGFSTLALVVGVGAALIAGCASPPPPAPAPPPPTGLSDVLDRPSERALFDGMRAYDDGQYDSAEAALRAALAGNLRSPRDRATAHKLMAFVLCTSNREAQCEAAFQRAREADPTFALSRAESGHPLWGPVYRRVLRVP